jgi:sugar (pentulose or hexulose) kinase
VTDWNNALKLGFDPAGAGGWPAWLSSSPAGAALPRRVVAPGAPVAPLTPAVAARLRMSPACIVAGGTTDSIAAFLAAGVTRNGEAVTSLGSTLAVKMLSPVRVDSAAHGIYSHRLGDAWLVGGASNTGGAPLRALFSDAALRELSARIDPSTPSTLDYYPLLRPGERFPTYDPAMQPRLTPRPEGDDVAYLHGILESIARIEARAYALFADMGAPAVTRVLTAGGGAANPAWTAIRARVLGVEVGPSPQGEASYGAALLARRAL